MSNEKKTKQINICLTPSDYKKLSKKAKEEDRTITDTARKLLLKALKN